MSQTYIVVINGKPGGPFDMEELKALSINPGDFVKTPAMDDYKEAHEIAELRELLGFSKQPVIPQYFGGFDQRLLASVLDWFMISGVFIIIAFLAVIFIHDKVTRLMATFTILGAIPVVKIIYHILMESSVTQATYGKQLLKIKVADLEGNRITTSKAVSRNLFKIFSVLTLFTGYLFAFFNKRQQCLHDMMANTLVIKDRLI